MPGIHQSAWWGAPKRFADRKSERKISWLELFYDLVYAAAVSRLTHHLTEHHALTDLGHCLLFFALIFWSWVNGSQYYDLHGSDGIRTRLLTFWQILAVAAVAITMEDAFNGQYKAFGVSFAILEIIITYLWWSVGLYDPSHRVFNKFYTANYLAAFVLIIISIFTSFSTTYWLWLVALVLNLTPPLTGAVTIVRVLKERGDSFTASAAIVERFGLFTIIVLAESIFGTISGVSNISDKQPVVWIGFMLGIFISFLLWSIYFDMTADREAKKGYANLQLLIFLHFPLLASFCVTGASINIMLSDMNTNANSAVQWMFCVAIATMLLMVIAITYVMKQEEEDMSYVKPLSLLLIIITVVFLIVPLAGCYLSNLTFLLLVAIALFVPVFIGVRSWVRYKSQQNVNMS